jgi:hypothetical protein
VDEPSSSNIKERVYPEFPSTSSFARARPSVQVNVIKVIDLNRGAALPVKFSLFGSLALNPAKNDGLVEEYLSVPSKSMFFIKILELDIAQQQLKQHTTDLIQV